MTSAQVVAVQFGLLRVGQQVGGVIKMAGLFLTTMSVERDQCASSSSAVWVASGGPVGRRRDKYGRALSNNTVCKT